MKKGFKQYTAAWAVIFVIFQLICFVSPAKVGHYTKYDATFWTAWAFMTLAFVGQLFCAHMAFLADSARKLFYYMPLITISYSGLILMLLCGAVTIAIPNLPAWVGIILCVIILGFTAVAVIKAQAAADIVEQVDEKVKTQTSFIRNITAEAESLMARAQSPETKAACKKVYEAFRYSDPVSSPELADIEAEITVKMDELTEAVITGKEEKTREITDLVINLIIERNNKCKALKG